MSSQPARLRKGTLSCWECKNQKIRCRFTPSSSACATCQRKGLSCTSQQSPNPLNPAYGDVERRISHVENLVAQLGRQHGADTQEESDNTPVDLSNYLQSLLPPAAVLQQILDRSHYGNQPFRMLVCSAAPNRASLQSNHPVHLARTIIQLALCLLQPTQNMPDALVLRCDQRARAQKARHFVDVASRHVTSQDFLIDSLDGLEALVLEAHYHFYVGNPRGAWLLFRRALGIAGILGLPRAQDRAQSLWFRLVYSDRFLSLMLGLPSVTLDSQIPRENQFAADEWSDRLERIHVEVVGRIIARNLRMQHRVHGNLFDGCQETQDIDYELRKAGRIPPVHWWLSPGTADVDSPEQFSRALTQMHQFYLLTVLHQPYLMHHLEPTPRGKHTDSRLAILFASREVLARFSMFRSAIHKIPFQGIVDKVFTAALCLLLIHLDGHRLEETVLEHQRPRDLAVIGDVIHAINDVAAASQDDMAKSCVQILFKLTDMEEYAARGDRYWTWLEDMPQSNPQAMITDQGMSFPLPYFGTFYVLRESEPNGHGTKEPLPRYHKA